MPKNEHWFVGVTYGEFQSLYHYGRGRVAGDRVVGMKMKRDGTFSTGKRGIGRLLERLPQLMLDDQEGILILELKPRESVPKSTVVEVVIGDVRNVIPTTRRAKRILAPRLQSLGLELDRPRFESPVLEQWSGRNIENAIDGGRELCRLLFGDGGCADEKLRAAVEAAIRQVDRQEGQNVEEDGAATWIPAAFQFTRHDPYEYGSINYLMDSGKVLTKVSWPEESNGVERCREVVRAMIGRRTAISTLADVARDAEVVNLAAELEEAAPGCFPSGFRSLVIFCRWKELFHRWREAVDAEALTAEARELIAADVDYWSVRESLWLLGCFAGHDRVAHLRYAAEGHPWWCGPKLSISKIAGPAAVTRRESEVERDATECTAVEAEKAGKESASGLPFESPE